MPFKFLSIEWLIFQLFPLFFLTRNVITQICIKTETSWGQRRTNTPIREFGKRNPFTAHKLFFLLGSYSRKGFSLLLKEFFLSEPRVFPSHCSGRATRTNCWHKYGKLPSIFGGGKQDKGRKLRVPQTQNLFNSVRRTADGGLRKGWERSQRGVWERRAGLAEPLPNTKMRKTITQNASRTTKTAAAALEKCVMPKDTPSGSP